MDSHIKRIDNILSAHNLKGCHPHDVYKILDGKEKKIGTMIHRGDLIYSEVKFKTRIFKERKI